MKVKIVPWSGGSYFPYLQPKMWNELQAGIECLTQLLLLIDIMSSSVISDPHLNEAAAVLQQQLIYNGEVLDLALESLRSYKEGTQSLTYLNASVHLAYALLRMLERWGKENTGAVYVRKKKSNKRKKATRKPCISTWSLIFKLSQVRGQLTKMVCLTSKTNLMGIVRRRSSMRQCSLLMPLNWCA